jgi:hypothetical protein
MPVAALRFARIAIADAEVQATIARTCAPP